MAERLRQRYSTLVELKRENLHTFVFWMNKTEPCVFSAMKFKQFERDGVKYMRVVVYCRVPDKERCEEKIKEYNDKIKSAV